MFNSLCFYWWCNSCGCVFRGKKNTPQVFHLGIKKYQLLYAQHLHSNSNTILEAVKLIELLLGVFDFLYSLPLDCRLLAAVPRRTLRGFGLRRGERSAAAVRTTVLSKKKKKSTFILSNYDMVWSPWKLQRKSFRSV